MSNINQYSNSVITNLSNQMSLIVNYQLCGTKMFIIKERIYLNCKILEQSNEVSTDASNRILRNKQTIPISKKGWITSNKEDTTFRLFIVNLHRFSPDNEEKYYQLHNKINQLNIDCYLFSSCDRK